MLKWTDKTSAPPFRILWRPEKILLNWHFTLLSSEYLLCDCMQQYKSLQHWFSKYTLQNRIINIFIISIFLPTCQTGKKSLKCTINVPCKWRMESSNLFFSEFKWYRLFSCCLIFVPNIRRSSSSFCKYYMGMR